MIVKWTKTALASLQNIAEFIEQDNPERAKKFVQEIRGKSKSLETFPSIGRAGRVSGTRELVAHENYILIYRVEGEAVQIIRVHHVRQKSPIIKK